MNDLATARAPVWVRIVATLGLLWNLFGCYAYLQSVGVAPPDPSMPPEAMPAWATGAFAIAVFGGALGSLGLLLLKKWGKLLLLVSFLGILATDLWAWVMRPGGPPDNMILPIAVNVIGLVLLWIAYMADRRGWLG